MNTSLQNIITYQTTCLRQSQVSRLFQKKTYPQFQIAQFQLNQQLMKKEEFVFFLKILQRWNKEANNRGQLLNDCAYTKNDFIFSSLKRLAVQNDKNIDSSLHKLFNWYNLTKNNDQTCYLKKQLGNKSQLQQWEIRNSYKSNLPLQINNYKRRFIFSQNPTCDNTGNRTADQSPTFNKENSNSSLLRKQNNYLQKYRQFEEVKEEMKTYRKNKVYFYKSMTKNYYKNQFKKDKMETSSPFFIKKDTFFPTDQIKSYRIKTTNGARPLDSISNSLPKNLSSTFSKFNLNNRNEKDLSLNQTQDLNSRFGLTNTNGLGLISNPFDVKLRKKKK